MEHRFAGLPGETFLTEPARRVRLAGIEGRSRTTNDVLGGVLVHVVDIRTKARVCKEGRSRTLVKKAGSDPGLLHLHAVIVRESGRSSIPRLLASIAEAGHYWMPAFGGMTKKRSGATPAVFLPSLRAKRSNP